jgi:hypothetical protein
MYTPEQQKEIDRLTAEVQQLFDKKQELLDKIAEIKWLHWSRRRKSDVMRFARPRYPMSELTKSAQHEWKDSFFYNHTCIVEDCGKSNFSPEFVEHLCNAQKFHPPFISDKEYVYGSHLACVDAIYPTEHGFHMLLSDPAGSICTSEITDIPLAKAEHWMGQIIHVEIGYRYHSHAHPVRNLYLTGYSKYNN